MEEEGEGERDGPTARRMRERGRGDYICLLLSEHLAVIANDLLISLFPLFECAVSLKLGLIRLHLRVGLRNGPFRDDIEGEGRRCMTLYILHIYPHMPKDGFAPSSLGTVDLYRICDWMTLDDFHNPAGVVLSELICFMAALQR